jgi:hypothetical protein
LTTYAVAVLPAFIACFLIIRYGHVDGYDLFLLPVIVSFIPLRMTLPYKIICTLDRENEYGLIVGEIERVGYVMDRPFPGGGAFRYPWSRWIAWKENDLFVMRSGLQLVIRGPAFSTGLLYKRLSTLVRKGT